LFSFVGAKTLDQLKEAAMTDPVLLTVTRIETIRSKQHLTVATGFFFARDDRLFLATSRHVFWDEPSGHAPDAIKLDLHVSQDNLAEYVTFEIPLLDGDGARLWRHGTDSAGEIDVAVIQLEPDQLPKNLVFEAFTPDHLLAPVQTEDSVEIGASLLAIGFPLGFHDTLHKIPVARNATLASSFGLRFQGFGYFLTDARTHRGISGAPIVMRRSGNGSNDGLPWALLGVHSGSFDMANRVEGVDDTLGLNMAWYADILLTLTDNDTAADLR
jgi:S1-C subfamily serine protease